ncbi:PREDICTED: uncharacterized protein LOC105563375 isoform X3 [Vollenhovia emeryi]|uniref:uncharacterized protein LOC105563375 isoform X3 n=1 Tax=Vollenhovia emeryi TaxID=411798 RepID=UPI0005F5381B|nr:PREDICTED: uncharacterized protein LOC105563375 isoform X3 [Vollenhovia emeryi]
MRCGVNLRKDDETAAVREMKWLCFIDGTGGLAACANGVMSIERGSARRVPVLGKPRRSANIGDAWDICTQHYEFRFGTESFGSGSFVDDSGRRWILNRLSGHAAPSCVEERPVLRGRLLV